MNIKELIKKNPSVYYLCLCLSKVKDSSFREKVLNIDKDYTVVKLEKYLQGDLVNDGLYVIEVGSSTIGFFALMRLVLNSLAYADYYGLKPIVVYKSCVSYQEEKELYGKKNSFEYYFKQTTDLYGEETLEYLKKRRSLYKCIPAHYTQTFQMYNLPVVQDYLLEKEHYAFLANIIKQHIQFQPHIERMLNSDLKQIGFTLGMICVHYRGSDFKNNYGSHPVSIGVEDYILAIKSLPEEFANRKIFLATDDIPALDRFNKEFGNRIVKYNDVQRTDGNLSVICSESVRDNHHFLLGYEVIRDMYTLSMGSCLVAGLSQVSIFARLYKLSRNEQYEHEVLMSKGVNQNNRSHVTDIERKRGKRE